MGELRALSALEDRFADTLTPLVEIPLTVTEMESDVDEEPPDSQLTTDPGKFAADLMKRWRPDRRIIVDATAVPYLPASGEPVIGDLVDRLAREDYAVVPTVRPSDDRALIEAVGRRVEAWRLGSTCIRLSGDDLDDVDAPIADALNNVLNGVRLEPEQVDLVLDFGPVQDEQAVAFAARIARLILGEIPHVERWRTLVCAAAGFPPDLNSVQPEVLTEIPRYDATMWQAIRARASRRVPDFGDYGIAYPTLGAGAPFAPAPQLRFTWKDHWLVYKGRKRDRRGSAQFYDICQRMVEQGVVDPALSWGDDYVERASRLGAAGGVTPGNAMTWRAIGTSHHLAFVANRLATRGAP